LMTRSTWSIEAPGAMWMIMLAMLGLLCWERQCVGRVA
jgi:hypothetical protein